MKKQIAALFLAGLLMLAPGCGAPAQGSAASSAAVQSAPAEDFLPLGTVVTLTDSASKIMIVGYAAKDSDGSLWDYCGVLYPDGYQEDAKLYRFNRTQVTGVAAGGYQNSEMESWLGQIKDRMQAKG